MNVTEQRQELTSWVSAQTVDDLATWPFDTSTVPLPERLGRYRIAGLIGAGGMGAVYQGSADGFSSPVAIKTLRKLSPTGLLGLKQEFRRTRALSHPNLVSLYELGQDCGTWFFSMELVHGESLLSYIWGGASFPGAASAIDRLSRLLPQLIDAISYLHQNNVLHLDIKPSNILVTPAGAPKLLDFGLSEAEFSTEGAEARGAFAGTPAYMAPEQLWGRHSKACDAYALGVTLFEAVAGRLPLAAQLETLLTKQTKPAPKVRDLVAEVPEHLARVIDALLERDPDRRLTVEGARHALGVVAIPSSIPPASPSANLVGREAEVSHLEHWLTLAKSQVVVGTVLGESGVGKTTVLNAAKHQWAAAGAWVMSSRCFEWQSIAFKAADSIIDGLFERLRPDAPNLSLPPDLALATSTFPVLAGLSLEPPSGRPTDKQLERDRALNALAALVADLAKRNPIVLCIDDAQWGDVESAELIARCAERTTSGLLVVLGSRPLSEGQSFRRRLSNVRAKHEALTLVPLTYSESYTLARRLAADGQWSDDELRSIALDAGGVPLFVEQVARFNQTLEARPKNLAEVVELQYRALPDPARRLLEVVVIDEQPTPLAAALLATGQAEKDFHALSQLQAHRFVRVEGLSEATVLEPYHDRVRRELLRLIPTETQRALHEALASALDSVGASPGHIAEHWFEAGRSKLAARWAVRAAEDAYLSLAFERAASLYSRALSWDACALDATPDLREQHAWALYHAGFCAQAGDAFVVASQVSHASRRHLLQGHAIEALLVAGEVDRGQAVLGNLLPQLGIRPVWRGFWGVVQLLSLIAWVRLKARRLRFRAKPDALALQRAEVTWAAGKALTNLLPVDGVVHLLRSLLFALESGDEVAIARGLNIAASGYVPFLEAKSRNLMEAATRITEKHPTAYLLGMREVALATASTMLGDWRKAISQIESASTYLEAADIPTHWERAVLAVNRTVSLEQLGDLRSATPFFENAAQTAKQRGDMVGYISNWASVGFCRLAANDLAGLNSIIEEYADVVASWRVGYGIWHTALWHLRVLRALRQHNYVEARRLLDVDWPHIVGAQLHRTRALRLYVFETRAAVCLGARPQTPAARRTWLKEARWLERQTANTNRLDARPNSLLIRAAISQFQGRLTDCLTELTQAAELYAAEGMAERELTVRWRIAQLTNNDEEERRRIERRAAELGVFELATWAPIRTPGFWP
jgi:tetratricopeptide (TPR) repeat protein